MTPETPEPPQPDGPGPSTDDPSGPRPPRILVSVGDLEDPADWDVIVVENDAIDDATALRIARERTGHVGAAVPSLDERDIAEAFSTDRDAEGAESLSVDAFAPPADLPRRAPVRPEAPPPMLDDGFGHLPGLDGEDDAEEQLAAGALPAVPAHPYAGTDGAALAEEPDGAFDPIDPSEEPVLARELLDDPEDDFYAIAGDAPAEPAEPERVAAFAPEPPAGDEDAAPGWTPPDSGIQRRALLDDPKDDFYAIGDDDLDLEPVPATGPTARVGLGRWGADEDAPSPVDAVTAAAVGAAHRAASSDELADLAPAEDEPVIDSHFPLGPDDLLRGEPDGATIEVDALDYANVFGPVADTHDNIPDLVPVRTRRAEEAMSLGLLANLLDEDERDDEEDEDGLIPVAAAGGRGRSRRRALAVLGMAGLVLAGLGAADQLLGGSDRPELVAGDDGTTSSSRVFEREQSQSNTTAPTIGIPVSPVNTAPDGSSTNTSRPRRTTTTRRQTTPPSNGSSTTSTTQQDTTTTTVADTTTTTQGTTTTTQCEGGATGGATAGTPCG